MTLFVYCPVGSTGAREVAREAGARRVRSHRWRQGDVVVCWGAHVPSPPSGVRFLNNRPGMSKQSELRALQVGGVRIPEFHLSRPPMGEWLARAANHQGGKDLLAGRQTGDFYVEKLPFTKEFRVHVWKGKSIRLGMKVPRQGVAQHPWIRSYDGGWKLSYGADAQQSVPKGVRDAAKKAVEVLGLDFGAVDVGVTAAGKSYVLEVNRRPGLEGQTTAVYGRQLREEAQSV